MGTPDTSLSLRPLALVAFPEKDDGGTRVEFVYVLVRVCTCRELTPVHASDLNDAWVVTTRDRPVRKLIGGLWEAPGTKRTHTEILS